MDDSLKEQMSNVGAERQILANCIQNQKYIMQCDSEGLTPKHFGVNLNGSIFNAMMYLFTKNLSIDSISILSLIKQSSAKSELERFGGDEYVFLLTESPTTDNINLFCKQVAGEYIRRKAYELCEGVQQQIIANPSLNVLELINTKTMELTLSNTKKNAEYKMGDLIEERLEAQIDDQIQGISIGMEKYDNLTGGATGDDLTVVVADSKVGKSIMLLNWAENIAMKQQLPTLFIDTEQKNKEQEYRLLSIMSQIPEVELKHGLYKRDTAYGYAVDKHARLTRAVQAMKSSKFFHVYMPDFTTEKIIAKTREYYLKEGIVAMFFDYIHLTDTLIASYKGMRDDVILTTLATSLKQIGGDLDIPIFTANQTNRSAYGEKELDAKNIGGSIGVLQKASKLLFLRNLSDEELVLPTNRGANQKLLIKYQRHGESGQELNIMFNAPFISMTEV